MDRILEEKPKQASDERAPSSSGRRDISQLRSKSFSTNFSVKGLKLKPDLPLSEEAVARLRSQAQVNEDPLQLVSGGVRLKGKVGGYPRSTQGIERFKLLVDTALKEVADGSIDPLVSELGDKVTSRLRHKVVASLFSRDIAIPDSKMSHEVGRLFVRASQPSVESLSQLKEIIQAAPGNEEERQALLGRVEDLKKKDNLHDLLDAIKAPHEPHEYDEIRARPESEIYIGATSAIYEFSIESDNLKIDIKTAWDVRYDIDPEGQIEILEIGFSEDLHRDFNGVSELLVVGTSSANNQKELVAVLDSFRRAMDKLAT